jgi:glutamate dehydrogenase (NAD(P)+)
VTGYGVAEAADAAEGAIDLPIAGARVAIQGFGAVGQAAAVRLVELGAVVTAVSTANGAVVDHDGLDVVRLVALRAEHGDECVHAYGSPVDADLALTTDAQILIPAAREDVIDKDLAKATSAALIVEGANLPTTPAAREILHERGVVVVPDFIANAGGTIAAAHSMDARYSPFPVVPDTVFAMISVKMRQNAETVVLESRRLGLAPHLAARAIAQDRVRAAMRVRGQLSVAG